MGKNTQIAERPNFAIAERPDFIKVGDRRGTEQLTSNDIRPPALRLAQSMTPETKRSEGAYLEGLQEGMLFNSLTKEIYGGEPVQFVIVEALGHRNVEFKPLNEGGGVVDFNVPDNDPRAQFTTVVIDGRNVRQKPVATTFYDYLIMLLRPEGHQLMTLSLKGTQLKKAKDLNSLIFSAKMPSFSFVFSATPTPEKKGTFSYFGWRIERAGYVSREIYDEAEGYQASLAGKKIVLDTEIDATVEDVEQQGASGVPF